PMDLILLLITVDLGLKPEATKWVRSSGSLLFLGRPDGKSLRDIFVFFSLSPFVWWGARLTISQTREAHKPANPTNSWGASRTILHLDGELVLLILQNVPVCLTIDRSYGSHIIVDYR